MKFSLRAALAAKRLITSSTDGVSVRCIASIIKDSRRCSPIVALMHVRVRSSLEKQRSASAVETGTVASSLSRLEMLGNGLA